MHSGSLQRYPTLRECLTLCLGLRSVLTTIDAFIAPQRLGNGHSGLKS